MTELGGFLVDGYDLGFGFLKAHQLWGKLEGIQTKSGISI